MPPLTSESPLARRFWAYLRERYDPAQFVPFHALTVAAAAGLMRLRYGVPADAGHLAAGAALTAMLLAFYFVLRVSDEHKDWEADRVAHPDRLLSRGVIRHGHLRAAAWAAVAGMLALAAPFGPTMLAGTAVLLGYAALMLREFFVGDWLRQRLLLYGVSHNVVVFLSVHLVFLGFGLAAGRGAASLADPWAHAAALALNLLVFSLEVARKVRTPEAERDGVDTYSRGLGLRGAAALLVGVQGAGAALLLALLLAEGAPLAAVRGALVAVGLALLLVPVGRLVRRPEARAAERLVLPAGGAVLLYLLAAAL